MKIVCADPARPGQPCPVCGGLGLVKYAVPMDDARFGKLFRCPNYPAAADLDHQARLRKLSHLEAFQQHTLENFEIDPARYQPHEYDSLLKAWHAARDFAEQPRGWLLLEGSYGSGKTHLAAAVGNARVQQGDPVLFITVPDLLDHLRQTYRPEAELSYDELFDRVRNVALLILDDLGVENPGPWAQEKLFQLLNHRHAHRLNTIITTNTSLNDLDARLRSRLLDHQLVRYARIIAPDFRSFRNYDDRLIANLSIYAGMTFESFETDYPGLKPTEKANVLRVYQACLAYADRPQGWLVIAGDDQDGRPLYGNGKTHLAAAIALRRRERGDEVIFATMTDLLDYLRESFNASSSSARFERRYETLRDVKLLVIDDLNTRSLSDWGREKIFQLLDYRYVRQMQTVFTLATPAELDARLASRMLDTRRSSLFKLIAPAYALRHRR